MQDLQVVQITQQLRNRYPQVALDVLHQFVSVKRLLMNQGYGNQKLGALQNLLGQRNISLDQFLTEEEGNRGLERRAEVSDVLSRDAFRAFLQAKQQILDGGTPPDHGPHTHRLQWYIIYRAADEGHLGDMRPVTLYQMLAQDECCDPRNPNRTIWDEIFDFDQDAREIIGVASDASDEVALLAAGYSSPEFLLSRLTRGNVLPPGPLTRELKRIRLRQETFGRDGVLNYSGALRTGILTKTFTQNPNADINTLQGELQNLLEDELERRYCALNPGYQERLNQI